MGLIHRNRPRLQGGGDSEKREKRWAEYIKNPNSIPSESDYSFKNIKRSIKKNIEQKVKHVGRVLDNTYNWYNVVPHTPTYNDYWAPPPSIMESIDTPRNRALAQGATNVLAAYTGIKTGKYLFGNRDNPSRLTQFIERMTRPPRGGQGHIMSFLRNRERGLPQPEVARLWRDVINANAERDAFREAHPDVTRHPRSDEFDHSNFLQYQYLSNEAYKAQEKLDKHQQNNNNNNN
jgi:hypothetical protein